MRALDLKIPPVVVGLFVAGLMWFVSWILPSFAWTFTGQRMLALGVASVGAVISGLGVVLFKRAHTTVNPMKPESSSSLVHSGVYGYTRNPMYLGFLLALAGWALWLSNALTFLLLPVFVLYMNRFQIEPEERALHALFGQEFVAYASSVRRWI